RLSPSNPQNGEGWVRPNANARRPAFCLLYPFAFGLVSGATVRPSPPQSITPRPDQADAFCPSPHL
ncbi:MAG: hypothetical protein U0694_19515, partial [Anaerolineae bacterium]